MTLIVSPLSQMAAVCAMRRPSHLLTLLSPNAAGLRLPRSRWPDRRRALAFHDIAAPQAGLTAPDVATVQAILDFADDWTGERPLLVHCWAGISRSTAAAFVLACRRRPDVDEGAIARALRAASPTATPNPLIVGIADEILERQGRMSAAVAAIGRGAEASSGRAFDLDPAAL